MVNRCRRAWRSELPAEREQARAQFGEVAVARVHRGVEAVEVQKRRRLRLAIRAPETREVHDGPAVGTGLIEVYELP